MKLGRVLVVVCALVAFVALGAGSAPAAASTIDSFLVQGTSSTFSECGSNSDSHSDDLPGGGNIMGSGPYNVSHTFSPQQASSSCGSGGGTDTTSGSMSSNGGTDASGGVTLSDSSQGSTTANATFTGGTDSVDIGADIATTTTTQFTIAAATPFNFSGNLSSSGVQTAGQGRVSYSLIRTSSPSATIFDQSQGLSPNINGTLQPGSYQYRVHGDASNDFCCSTTGTETDSYNYNVQLNVGTPAASTVPSNVTPPSISGTAAPGQTLSCSNGTWTNGPTGFTYQWNRDGAAISGATNQTYVVQPADQGHTLTCTVTASNSGGTSSPSTSAGVLVPAAQAPAAAKCRVSSTGKVKVARTKRHAIAGGRLPVRVTCGQGASVKLAANLSDTPPRKRHGPKPRAKHFRLAAVNGTVRAGVTVVLNRKLSAQAVRDLLHGARESADLTLTAHNANGTSHATGHLARLRT